MRYVHDFAGVDANTFGDLAIGNKSKHCALLYQAYASGESDEPAPEGVFVIGESYRLHLTENNLMDPIREILLEVYADRKTRSEAEAEIAFLIIEAPMPSLVSAQIRFTWKKFDEQFGSTHKRIPRSDCTIGEDTATKAGAGKHHSFPGIRSVDDLILGVKKVWASTFTSVAIADFANQFAEDGELLHLKADMAVPILREISSEEGYSSIVFSRSFTLDRELDKDTSLMEVTVLPFAHGEELVGGKRIPNRALILPGNLDKPNLNWLLSITIEPEFEEVGFGLTLEQLRTIAIRRHRKHLLVGPTDSELAAGADGVPYTVQERPNTQNLSRLAKQVLTVYEVPNQPELAPLATGSSVAEMCAVGVAHHLTSLSELDRSSFAGKILISQEALPDLTVLASITEDKRPAGLICVDGTTLGHLAINLNDSVPAVVGAIDAKHIPGGQTVTLLMGNVYEGTHPFEVSEIDLSALPPLTGICRPTIVDSNPFKAFETSKFLAKAGSGGFGLIRQEGVQQISNIPPILSCIFFDKVVDPELKAYIARLVRGNELLGEFSDPVEMYVQMMAAAIVPMAKAAQAYGGKASLRAYGGRVYEDNPRLEDGFLPTSAFTTIGSDGFLMYSKWWGSEVLKVYARIWRTLVEKWGITNVPVFLPNVANLREWLEAKSVLESMGIAINRDQRPFDYEVELAVESVSAIYAIPEFYAHGVDRGSFGFNDIRQSFELFLRDDLSTVTRGDLDDTGYARLIDSAFDWANDCGLKLESCGTPTLKVAKQMVRRGAVGVGFVPGKKFVQGYLAIAEAQNEA